MIFKICAAGLLCAALGMLLSEMGWRGKRVFTAVCAAVLLSALSEGVSSLFGKVMSVSEAAGISEVAKSAVKIIGVGYIFGVSSDICTELGENTLAGTLTMAGRVEILLIVLPYFIKILSFGLELIE